MRKVLLFLIVGILVGCTSKRYLLTDNNRDKKYLIEYIKDLKKQGKISNRPLIIIDGLAFGYENLKVNKIPLSKADIFKIDYLLKDSEVATNVYGERGKNGVLLISTKKSQDGFHEKSTKSLSDSKVLFLIGDRQITQEELQKIDPNNIESIEVIKEKNSVSKYTSDDYDGVVIIIMKKEKTKDK
jgi:hypothetical protein